MLTKSAFHRMFDRASPDFVQARLQHTELLSESQKCEHETLIFPCYNQEFHCFFQVS